MKYRSSTELFVAIESLQQELASSGCEEASKLVSEGVSGLNGLTDGWAYLLDQLNLIQQEYGSFLTSKQSAKLSQIQKFVHGVVHRA